MSELLSAIIYKEFPIGTIAIFTPCDAPQAVIYYVSESLRGNGLDQFTIKIVKTDNPEWVGCIAAQRFNIGNWGRKAAVMIKGVDFYNSFEHYFDCSAIRCFVEALLDVTSFDHNPITIINWCPKYITPARSYFETVPCHDAGSVNKSDGNTGESEYISDAPARSNCHSVKNSSSQHYEDEKLCKKQESGVFARLKDKLSSLLTEKGDDEYATPQIDLTEVNHEENSIVSDVERDKKIYLDRISAIVLDYVTRFNEVPPMEQIEEVLRGKLIIKSKQTSPIVVNRDLKVILPAYNELELRFSPLLRTIYILFLNHPEGIVFKQIADYRREIENIYLLIKPGGKDALMKLSIDELCDPMSGSLLQKISKINRIVKSTVVNPELSEHYIIGGLRGQPYHISLESSQITLPLCVRS